MEQENKKTAQRPKIERAENAKEFKEKYGRKRFKANTAGLAYVLNYMYISFLRNDGISYKEIGDKKLLLYKDLRRFHTLMTTDEEFEIYNTYIMLIEWLRTAFDNAVYVRNSALREMALLSHIINNTMTAESLTKELQNSPAYTEDIKKLLSLMSLESYTSSKIGANALSVREQIDDDIRYVHMFNEYIGMISDAIKIPEFTIYQISTDGLNDSIEKTNLHFKKLRESPRAKSLLSDDTQALLSDIQPAPQIQDDIRKQITFYLDTATLRGHYIWNSLYDMLKTSYYRGLGIDALYGKDGSAG